MVHTEWNAELKKLLDAPIPANEISSKNQGGQNIRFTSDKYVMNVLDEAVGVEGWSEHYTVTNLPKPFVLKVTGKGTEKEKTTYTLGQVVCDLTVLGVPKSATAEQEYTPGMYGSPVTNAQARAFKKAAMKFHVAKELWDKTFGAESDEEDERPTYRSQSSNRSSGSSNGSRSESPRQSSGGSSGGLASPAQVNYLTGDAFSVPEVIAKKLTGGKEGAASALITALKAVKAETGRDEYEDNPTQYIREAMENIVADKEHYSSDIRKEIKGQIGLLDTKKAMENLPDYDDDEDED